MITCENGERRLRGNDDFDFFVQHQPAAAFPSLFGNQNADGVPHRRLLGRRQARIMPDGTLEAFYDHGEVGDPLAADGGDSDTVLAKFAGAGIDVAELGAQLQREGADSFVSSWKDLMTRIEKQSAALD